MDMPTRTVLALGKLDARPFKEMVAWLRWVPGVQLVSDEQIGGNEPFDLLILCSERPGQFTPREIELLRHRYPLATVVLLYGPWCHGEGRTGPVPDGVVRVAWFEWSYRLPSLLEVGPLVPATATPQEQLLGALADRFGTQHSRQVGIWANTWDDFDYLRSACQSLGYASIWLQSDPQSPCDILLGLIPGTDGAEFADLQARLAAHAEQLALVCLATPTWEDYQKLRSTGVSAVLGQPFRLADLANLLETRSDCGILPLVNPQGSR
ncbi:hypothetical protein [Bremerella cremea]|uniref:hypothetical protein n=2 Tax=Bremerella cremea TaxID=1031537 RepID=UPI0031ED6D78